MRSGLLGPLRQSPPNRATYRQRSRDEFPHMGSATASGRRHIPWGWGGSNLRFIQRWRKSRVHLRWDRTSL